MANPMAESVIGIEVAYTSGNTDLALTKAKLGRHLHATEETKFAWGLLVGLLMYEYDRNFDYDRIIQILNALGMKANGHSAALAAL